MLSLLITYAEIVCISFTKYILNKRSVSIKEIENMYIYTFKIVRLFHGGKM